MKSTLKKVMLINLIFLTREIQTLIYKSHHLVNTAAHLDASKLPNFVHVVLNINVKWLVC